MAGLSKFLRGVGAKQILVPHIDRYLERGEFPKQWDLTISPYKEKDKFSPTFHPSGDCLLCERQLFKKFTKPHEKEQLSATSQKNFAVGNFWHIWLQTILVDGLGFATWDDVEKGAIKYFSYGLTRNVKFHGKGSADIICDIPGRGKYLVDFKTMNSVHFKMDDGMLENILLKKWRHQVNCYMDWLDLDQCIIIGIQKDTPHAMREFPMDRDQALLEPVYERWTTAAEYIRAGQTPVECLHTEMGLACPATS